jgi:L-malate glycosyltransferase
MPRPLNIFVPHCSDVLTDHLPHGDGLIAYGFITSLARRGHRFHVAAQQVELREPVHPNITIHRVALKRSSGMQSRLEYMFRVRSLLQTLKRSMRFDLIHQLNPVFTGISLAMAGSGLPLVLGNYVARWPIDFDPSTADGGGGRVMTRVRDLIAAVQQRQAGALVLTTPAAWNRLPHLEAVRSRIHVIPHGLDTALFSPKPDWNSDQNLESEQRQPTILFFANVVKRKGIFPLIEAFQSVLREFKNCKLQVAGDGPDLNQVKRRVAELDCLSQVEFLGQKERTDAPELYRNCSIYCLPSYGEPYGMTVVEAMSCARALVVTDCGALPHLVHEQGGMRVPAGQPEALAQALACLLRNPKKRVEMGRYNRQLVESRMSWDRVAQQLEVIYEIVVSERATPSNRDLLRPVFEGSLAPPNQEQVVKL